ncbi:MAG TPA: NAD-dependent epimerase/dehydratase family protein [Pyrinomonadaceae bacterium]|jgi:nucleoside-diphosphate-sugar epimerase
MKVLLTGASGYIGGAVAEALRDAGHEVFGMARSDEAAQRLAARGIETRRGDLYDEASIGRAAREVEGVIHAASTGGTDMAQTDLAAVREIIAALEGTGRPFIYTSGVWVYGNTGEHVADEESVLNPTPLVAWRPPVEQLVLASAARGVRSIVIRPAMVYGRGGGSVGEFVEAGREKGRVRIVGTGDNRWSFVHVDDLADLYVRALEHAEAGTLLLAANGAAIRVREVAEAASRAAGLDGRVETWPLDEARKTLGAYADALVLDQQMSGNKAMSLLGWSPQAPSVLEELERSSDATAR